MKTDTIITLGVVAVGGYFLYRIWKKQNPTPPADVKRILENQGFKPGQIQYTKGSLKYNPFNPIPWTTTPTGSFKENYSSSSTLSPGSNLIHTGDLTTNSTYKLDPGDYDQLNLAQKILLPLIPKLVLG